MYSSSFWSCSLLSLYTLLLSCSSLLFPTTQDFRVSLRVEESWETRNFLSLKRCFWKYGVCAFVNIYLCCHAKIERFELFFLFFFITFFVFFTHAFVKKTKNAFILAFRCNCNWHTHCCCIQILIISFVSFGLKSSRYIKKESHWKLNEKLKEMKIKKIHICVHHCDDKINELKNLKWYVYIMYVYILYWERLSIL